MNSNSQVQLHVCNDQQRAFRISSISYWCSASKRFLNLVMMGFQVNFKGRDESDDSHSLNNFDTIPGLRINQRRELISTFTEVT